MDLNDLGNLGEFVSALAVIVSLIYLALQIRNNSRQTRLSNIQQMLDASKEMMLVSTNADFTHLFMKERLGEISQGDEEANRLRGLRMAQLRNIENAFFMNREQVLDDEIFEIFKKRAETIIREDPGIIEGAIHSQSFKNWLIAIKGTTPDDGDT